MNNKHSIFNNMQTTNPSLPVISLKQGKDESLRRYHPWVFSGAIARRDAGLADGDLVEVCDAEGNFIALGHYQGGTIAVRVLSFEKREIDHDFWVERMKSARAVREAVGLCNDGQGDTFRLVHGEGDNLPGLIIDCYGKTAVMQAHSVGMHRCRHQLAKALVEVMADKVRNVYYKSETTLPFLKGEGEENGFLCGGNDGDVAMENGLKFHVDWVKGQKTGFFIDQRENRSLLEQYAKERSVLNMCCYTGGFSFYAMRGGAKLVHSVDSSAKAIELTNLNVELNFPGDTRHEAFCEDAFKFLDKAQGRYDLVILDPPAFAKHRGALHHALKGYTRLNAKAMENILPGGVLFTFSCSQVVTKDQFRNAVFTAAAQARRKVRILHQLHQPADHPVNIYHPEGEYLKGLVLFVE